MADSTQAPAPRGLNPAWAAGVLALLAAALLALRAMPPVRNAAVPDVAAALPDRVGVWQGHAQWFCQREACLKVWTEEEVLAPGRCPLCGGPLETVSLAERQVLPADTRILKREYRDPADNRIQVTVVISGAEQRSIHRPQQCLPAQGYVIERSHVESVPLEGRAPLEVMVLDLRRQPAAAGAKPVQFVYWFAGGGRETPRHLERLLWMSADLLLRNRASRWAYLTVMARPAGASGDEGALIRAFLPGFHAAVHTPAAQ